MLILIVGLTYFGYDHLCQAWQKQEAWSGTVVRVYREKTFLGGIKPPKNHYWDVWTTDGEVRSVRIWSRSLWSGAIRGVRLIKRSGELHPEVVGRP